MSFKRFKYNKIILVYDILNKQSFLVNELVNLVDVIFIVIKKIQRLIFELILNFQSQICNEIIEFPFNNILILQLELMYFGFDFI